MSEFNGEPLQTEKVYDEDEEVEVKYEPFDSELIRESEILGYASGCLTCQKVIKKITAHLTDHVGSSSNDVDGLTEPPEYIVDPNYIIKIEPEDHCLKSDPRDVGIMNDTQRPGSHDSSNSGQRQCKVLDFDTGQCSPDCEICKKYLRELREHLAINHPQLQFQPGCAPAPLPGQSTVHGPLKTLTLKNTRPHLRQIGKTVDGKYILKVVLTPDMEKQNRLEDMRRKTQTSMRAGYVEESITTHPSSSNPGEKKLRPDSDRNDQNKNEESKPTNRVSYDDNSDSENKSKESESEGRSSNEIRTEDESTNLSSTSAVSLGENAESSDNLTDHLSHAGLESQDITQTGDDLTEMSKTTVEGVSIKMIHGGRRESKMHHSEETVDVPTDTGEKQAVIFLTGGRNRKMSRIADKMSHTEEKSTNFDQIMSEPAKTVDAAGELPNLTHTGVIPSMTTRSVDRPTVTQSGGKRKSTKMLKPEFLKRLKSSESESTSTTPLDNSYNRKKCGKIFSANNNLWHRNYVVYGDKRFECSECGQSFMTRNALTLHEKIYMLRNKLLVKNCQNKVRGQLSHTGGNSTFCVLGEPLTKTLRIGKPTNSIRIDHEVGKETQISNSGGESNAPAHIGTHPGPVTTIGAKSENVDCITVASGKSTNMATEKGKLVSMILAVQELANMTHGGEELENTTSTVEKSPKLTVTGRRHGVIVDAGGESTNMNRVEGRSWNMSRTAGKLGEMGHTEEKPEELACIMGDPVRPGGLTTHVVIEIASEEEEGPFKCEICEKSFDRAAGLALHKLDHTDFPCDECGINFSSSDRLSDHKRHHALGTLHTCDECRKGFELLKWLTAHYEFHMRNFPFHCDECNCSMRFKTQSDLITHMVTRHGQKLFGCDVCGMHFQTPPDLMTHMVIHLGQKPFRCDICEERFKGREEWNSHMVIHSGEEQKRHRCGSCGKAFNRAAQLTDHSVIHSARPFKCYICGKCFEILPELTHHIVIHSEWKPYNCYICQERSEIPRNVKDPAKKTASEESVKSKGRNEGRNKKKTNNDNETEKQGPSSKIPVKVPKSSRKRKDESSSSETDSDDDFLLISRVITPERVFQIPNKFSMEKFKAVEENQPRIRGLPVAQFLPDYDTFKAINRRLSLLYKVTDKPYRCALCSHLGLSIQSREGDAFHAFKQAQDFERHYETHHHTRPTCPICKEPFDTSRHVQGHMRHMVARGHEAHIRGQVDLKARATSKKVFTAEEVATGVKEALKVKTVTKKKSVSSSDSGEGQNDSGSKKKYEKNPKKKSRKR